MARQGHPRHARLGHRRQTRRAVSGARRAGHSNRSALWGRPSHASRAAASGERGAARRVGYDVRHGHVRLAHHVRARRWRACDRVHGDKRRRSADRGEAGEVTRVTGVPVATPPRSAVRRLFFGLAVRAPSAARLPRTNSRTNQPTLQDLTTSTKNTTDETAATELAAKVQRARRPRHHQPPRRREDHAHREAPPLRRGHPPRRHGQGAPRSSATRPPTGCRWSRSAASR